MIFWLTVRTGICDLELVFGFHSFLHVMGECSLIYSNSMDSTPADDLQKRFPIYHVCPKYLPAYRCGSAFPENGLAFHQELDEVGKTLVDW